MAIPAMIENQLERSYHDDLGEPITDLTANGAMPAIYYVSELKRQNMSQPYLVYKFMPEVRYCRKLQTAGFDQLSFLFNAGSGTKGFGNGLGDLGWPLAGLL